MNDGVAAPSAMLPVLCDRPWTRCSPPLVAFGCVLRPPSNQPLSRYGPEAFFGEAMELLSPDSRASSYAKRYLALELYNMMLAFAKDGTSRVGKTHLPGLLNPVDFARATVKLLSILDELIVGAGCVDVNAVRMLQQQYVWARGCAKLTRGEEAATLLRLAYRSIRRAAEMAATCFGDDHGLTQESRRATAAFRP